jgi:hypothetical protein
MHTAKSLKINHIVFSYTHTHTHTHTHTKIKNSKICISTHFGLNNQFIKVTRTRPIYQKFKKKIILFSFNICGYNLIRKTYSGY